jgi:hypothetical protein
MLKVDNRAIVVVDNVVVLHRFAGYTENEDFVTFEIYEWWGENALSTVTNVII